MNSPIDRGISCIWAKAVLQLERAVGREIRGPLAHPPEPGYPCCVSALGELAWMAPREGPHPLYGYDFVRSSPVRAG